MKSKKRVDSKEVSKTPINNIAVENHGEQLTTATLNYSTNSNPLRIIFTNADQFTAMKKLELLQHVSKIKPQIIAICEIKPKKQVQRSKIDYQIPCYTMHPTDIDPDNGRGIVIFVHESVATLVKTVEIDTDFEEFRLLEFKLCKNETLLFGCFYRSPTPSATSDFNNNSLNLLIRSLSRKDYDHICFVGDFNFKDINWNTWTTPHLEESKEEQFLEAIRDSYLHQHITKPTRRRGTDTPSTIDLIFTNELMQVSNIEHLPPLGKSDHDVISFHFNCSLDYSKTKSRYNYNKADYNAI